MSLKYGILGFLSVKSMTGYELHKQWPKFNRPSVAFIYRALSGLLKENLVESIRIDQEKRPDRNVFSITEKGLVELDKWIGMPHRFSLPRSTLLVQVYFGARVGKEKLLSNLSSEHNDIKELIDTIAEQSRKLQTTRRKPVPDDIDTQLKHITYDAAIYYLKSIDSMISLVEEKVSRLPDVKPPK